MKHLSLYPPCSLLCKNSAADGDVDAWHHENEELTDLYGVPSIMDDPCVCWRYKYGRTASLSPFGVFALKFHSTYRTQHRNFGAEVPIHRNFRYNGRIGAEPAVISSPELSQGNVAELLSDLSPENTKTPQLTSAAAFESPLRRIFFEINRSGMRRTLLFWSDIVALYI